MKAMFRGLGVVVLVLSAVGMSASPVGAAAPSNDTAANATLVTVGFSETLDTTEATTDSDDAQLNATCGAPATDASVWYTIVGNDNTIIIDVSSSSYSAGVLVGVGTPGSLTTVWCGPGTVGFYAASGTTYYVLAIDDQQDGTGNGGNLNIQFTELPPAPTLDLTVNRFGTASSKTGIAKISGTYTCSNGDFVDLTVEARQNVGRFSILGSGNFYDFGTCDGSPHNWTASVVPQNGKFSGGKTLTVTFGYTCGPFECSYGYMEQKVQLRSGK